MLHVGDIHSGKQYCTEAYDRTDRRPVAGFADPLVYTPGDNEWTDCHKAGRGRRHVQRDHRADRLRHRRRRATRSTTPSGDPARQPRPRPLDLLPAPGAHARAAATLHVLSQAQVARPARTRPDAQYVENVMWEQQGVLFVTVNMPGGSNNDTDPWYGAPPRAAAQQHERSQRTAADLRWLDLAFDWPRAEHAAGRRRSSTQADMWDLDGKAAAHLTSYEPIVASLADHTQRVRQAGAAVQRRLARLPLGQPARSRARRAPATPASAPTTPGTATRPTTCRTSTASWCTAAPSRWSG